MNIDQEAIVVLHFQTRSEAKNQVAVARSNLLDLIVLGCLSNTRCKMNVIIYASINSTPLMSFNRS